MGLVLLGGDVAEHPSAKAAWPKVAKSRNREEGPGTRCTLQRHVLIELLRPSRPHQVLPHPATNGLVDQSVLGTLHIQTTTRNLKYVNRKSGPGPGRYSMNGAKIHQLYTESGGMGGSKGLICSLLYVE